MAWVGDRQWIFLWAGKKFDPVQDSKKIAFALEQKIASGDGGLLTAVITGNDVSDSMLGKTLKILIDE